MPCYDPRSSEDAAENKRRLDLATRLLCETCTTLKTQGYLNLFARDIPGLLEWFDEHQRLDAERER